MKINTGKLNNKINIFIDNHPEWGGTYQYTQSIIKAIQSKFHMSNIKLYYTNNIWDEEINEEKNFINYNLMNLLIVHILIFFNLINLPKKFLIFLLPSFPKSFFDENEYWIFPSQDIISIICRGKTIVSINDLMHRYSHFTETSSFFRKFFRDYKFKKIAEKSYRVLVDSKLGEKHVIESYGTYNNVKVQYFTALKKKEIKKNFNNFGKYLIYPAQYWQHKNHTKLILAIKILKNSYKDIKIILIGHKKKDFSKIKKLVSNLKLENNVIFLGYVSDLEKAFLIHKARALINPTYLGPTNIPQLEAFNYGCPVILSNVFAAKEQCKDNVIYFDPNYEDSIAKSIEKIWRFDEVFQLYKNKSLEISKKYSFEKFSDQLIKNIY